MSTEQGHKNHARVNLPVSLIKPHKDNPNKMSEAEFNLLVDNLEQAGFTDPVLVWPYDLEAFTSVWDSMYKDIHQEGVEEAFHQLLIDEDIQFMTIGGHHRVQGAVYLSMDSVPCTVIMDPEFDEEKADMQLLRHNTIHGKLDPIKFMDLYSKYEDTYGDVILQDMMGFADEAEFNRLKQETVQSMPKHLQDKFKEAAEEIKTVDGLAKLMNEMFTKYGDTMPYGYMLIDFGGKKSYWLRVSDKTYKAIGIIGDICLENSRTLDDIMGAIVQSIAKGDLSEEVTKAIAATKEVKIPSSLQTSPTQDNIEKANSVLD